MELKPRRFDLAMSKRTRRQASLLADQGQAAVEGFELKTAL
jgi:hypothetical protein